MKSRFKRKRHFLFACIALIYLLCEVSQAQQHDMDTSQDLYLAKRAFGDGFYQIALNHFQKYLQDNPQAATGETQIYIGRCYLGLNQFSEAVNVFREILDQGPKDNFFAQVTYWMAHTYFKAKDYESALEHFQKIVEHYPKSEFWPQSHYYRASCYYKLNQFKQALEFYKELKKSFPKHELKEESSFRIAQCLYNMKDYSRAHKEFSSFVKKFSDSVEKNAAFYYLGEIEYNLGNYEQAVKYYMKAAQISPKSKISAYAKYGAGWAYLKLGEYQQALEVFRRLQRSSEFGQALEDSLIFAQARCNASLNNYEKAIQMYEQIIKEFSYSSWYDDAFFWKGEALSALGRYPEAVQIYEEAIAKFSLKAQTLGKGEDSTIYEREDLSLSLLNNLRYSLGWTYARMKKYAQAITQFNQVFEKSDDRFLKSGALSRIGDIYLEQGRKK